VLRVTTLPLYSYLNIYSYYEVPIQMSDEATGRLNFWEGWESLEVMFSVMISFAKERSHGRW
jgi:hypothetical protein